MSWHMVKLYTADIIAVQETHLTIEQEYAFKLYSQNYNIFFSHGTSQATGVFMAIHRNHGLSVVLHQAVNAHIQYLDILYNETNYQIINLYAPTVVDKRKQCYAELKQLIITDSTFVLGDFNSVQAASDRISGKLDGTSKDLSCLIEDTNVVECIHDMMFTFQSLGDPTKQSCLDLILGPKQAMVEVYQYQSWTSLSDHSLVVVHQKMMVDRGPGQWHFPEDALEDDKLMPKISQLLQSELHTDSISMHWEMLKLEI